MAERFNAPGILRMLDAEAAGAFGGSERTKIEVVARFIRALVAENEYVRARLELETAALEQACAAPVDQPLTVQAVRGTVETELNQKLLRENGELRAALRNRA